LLGVENNVLPSKDFLGVPFSFGLFVLPGGRPRPLLVGVIVSTSSSSASSASASGDSASDSLSAELPFSSSELPLGWILLDLEGVDVSFSPSSSLNFH
jgi:hypothetical protein